MIKLIVFAGGIALICRMVTGKWPWEFMRAKPDRPQAVLKARQLLNVRADASHREIVEAHRRLVAIVHPDRGGTSAQVHEANAARDLLLGDLPAAAD